MEELLWWSMRGDPTVAQQSAAAYLYDRGSCVLTKMVATGMGLLAKNGNSLDPRGTGYVLTMFYVDDKAAAESMKTIVQSMEGAKGALRYWHRVDLYQFFSNKSGSVLVVFGCSYGRLLPLCEHIVNSDGKSLIRNGQATMRFGMQEQVWKDCMERLGGSWEDL
ncbi:hypothetical protein BKA67DRAFT_537255 [Truncatella angustata]|uniref:Uncharacterized protein n=1 Tax=Truncatella angustata TaxID=152316 RepID=A0A9P8UKF0_9PEZI|nr:uncharacterized protein BKA67DRAFT_537255 [Truncatella angustata]KAH6653623.1 hypothetical protein BKA67DRAFT_537255 [Truncatella angustata]